MSSAAGARGWASRVRSLDPSLLVVYVNVFLYAVCFQMQSPAQLQLVKTLVAGEEATSQFAWVKSVNGIAQLFGSLLSGYLVDKAGVRGVFMLSFFASAAIYACYAMADDIWWLYVAQVPAVFQHAVLAARTFVALQVPSDQQTAHFGYISVSYGLGFVIGPALGGYLSSAASLSVAPAIATAGSLVSMISLLLVPFPTDRTAKKAVPAASDSAPAREASGGFVTGMRAALQAPPLLWSLALKTIFSFGLAIFHSTFALVADRFGLDAAGTGYLMSYIGIVGMVTQALVVSVVSKRFSDYTLTTATTAVTALSFAAMSQISSMAALYAVCTPLVIANTIYQQVNTRQVSHASPAGVKGFMMATEMAIFSGMRIWTPALSAHILSTYGYWSIGAVSGGAAGIMFLLLATRIARCDAAPAPAPPADKPHAE